MHSIFFLAFLCCFAVFGVMARSIWKSISGVYTVCNALLSPFLVIYLLEANKKAMSMILRSFVFHFKIGYMTMYAVIRSVNIYCTDKADAFHLIHSAVYTLTHLLVVAWICSLDAMHIAKRTKVIVLTLFAVYISFFAIMLPFSEFFFVEYVVTVPHFDYSISTVSVMSGLLRTLSIFFWNQLVLTVIRTNKCISIKYTPSMRWVDGTEDTNHDYDAVPTKSKLEMIETNPMQSHLSDTSSTDSS